MRRDEFFYELPEELIAQHPSKARGEDRLLCLDSAGRITDRHFCELPDLLRRGDLLVFNDTRVIPARLFARKQTGGQGEVMVERVIDENEMLAQLGFSKAPRPGSRITVNETYSLEIVERVADLYRLRLPGPDKLMDLIEQCGHMPLPPYINRDDEISDRSRYQTIYASEPGAVAAPTAGLHFTRELMAELSARGIGHVFVTLHVGAGTFQPVRVENIKDHRMHSEYLKIKADTCELVNQARAKGGRIIAVGTTAVRCLETAAEAGELLPYTGETDIFIYPGYEFQLVDGLITNFHLPESTLLMLVCAYAGQSTTLAAYQHAIAENYRFYSYGDAMFIIHPRPDKPGKATQ